MAFLKLEKRKKNNIEVFVFFFKDDDEYDTFIGKLYRLKSMYDLEDKKEAGDIDAAIALFHKNIFPAYYFSNAPKNHEFGVIVSPKDVKIIFALMIRTVILADYLVRTCDSMLS